MTRKHIKIHKFGIYGLYFVEQSVKISELVGKKRLDYETTELEVQNAEFFNWLW